MIPIYRAKKIDSDEYVEGIFNSVNKILTHTVGWQVVGNVKCDTYFGELIDPSTLAIHFPDMIDSEGIKIFASLSEDGRGGDIAESECSNLLIVFRDNSFVLVHEPTCRAEAEGECKTDILNKKCIEVYNLKVTGIQQ